MTLVDTNVISDILSPGSAWQNWSIDRIDERRIAGGLLANEIVFAELSARFDREADVHSAFENLEIVVERMPTAALFLAGTVFRKYRTAGGVRTSVLADFFLGAHAQVTGATVLTRDVRRYGTYFPDVKLISP